MDETAVMEDPRTELAIIGAALLLEGTEQDALLAAGLEPEHMSRQHHAETWAAIYRVRESGRAVDIALVANELGATPDVYRLLDDALAAAPRHRNALEYAALLKQMAAARRKERQDSEARQGFARLPDELRAMLVDSAPPAAIAAHLRQIADEVTTTSSAQADGFSKRRAYTLDDFENDRNRPLLRLGTLPGVHAIGPALDALLGGVQPGDFVAVGAGSAGAGKTAFVMQLADGLALRTANIVRDNTPDEPLTPVFILSEMSESALALRTLARLVRTPAATFRGCGDGSATHDVIIAEARAQLSDGDAHELFRWQHKPWRPSDLSGERLLLELARKVGAWAAEIKREHPTREVWPIVIVDPIQRWQDPGKAEVEALNTLAEKLDQLADDNKWIVIATSDTNKTSATQKDARGAGIMRGSYKLMHSCDLVIMLGKRGPAGAGDDEPRNSATDETWLEVLKNRYGPGYGDLRLDWRPEEGLRFCAWNLGEASASRRVIHG